MRGDVSAAAYAPAGTPRALLRGISCLDVLVSRPHLCTSGGANGFVALYDLRKGGTAAVSGLSAGDGQVQELRFDPLLPAAAGMAAGTPPRVLVATDAGELCHAASGGSGGLGGVIPRESGAVVSFDVDACTGEDLLCVTENECLVYVRRTA